MLVGISLNKSTIAFLSEGDSASECFDMFGNRSADLFTGCFNHSPDPFPKNRNSAFPELFFKINMVFPDKFP